MSFNPHELIARINAAFDGVPRPTHITKSVARGIDDEWELTGRRAKVLRESDPEYNWKDISDDEIARHCDIFPFLDCEGYRFYLPAFMCFALRRFQAPHPAPIDFTMYACKHGERFELFDYFQLQCVRDFLEAFAFNSAYFDPNEDAAHAFDVMEKLLKARKDQGE